MVLLAAVIEMTNPPATELSLTRNTPSVLMWWARILLALSRAIAAWYQAWDLCTVACVSVSLSATGAATRLLKVQTKIIECVLILIKNLLESLILIHMCVFLMKYCIAEVCIAE